MKVTASSAIPEYYSPLFPMIQDAMDTMMSDLGEFSFSQTNDTEKFRKSLPKLLKTLPYNTLKSLLRIRDTEKFWTVLSGLCPEHFVVGDSTLQPIYPYKILINNLQPDLINNLFPRLIPGYNPDNFGLDYNLINNLSPRLINNTDPELLGNPKPLTLQNSKFVDVYILFSKYANLYTQQEVIDIRTDILELITRYIPTNRVVRRVINIFP